MESNIEYWKLVLVCINEDWVGKMIIAEKALVWWQSWQTTCLHFLYVVGNWLFCFCIIWYNSPYFNVFFLYKLAYHSCCFVCFLDLNLFVYKFLFVNFYKIFLVWDFSKGVFQRFGAKIVSAPLQRLHKAKWGKSRCSFSKDCCNWIVQNLCPPKNCSYLC